MIKVSSPTGQRTSDDSEIYDFAYMDLDGVKKKLHQNVNRKPEAMFMKAHR